MDYLEQIRNMPTVIDGNHESLYRAYHVLDKVKEWLRLRTNQDVILELVEHLEAKTNDTQHDKDQTRLPSP